MSSQTYEGVVRPFFRFWLLGVFISGGGVIAAANMVERVLAGFSFVADASLFGQSLVYVAALLFFAEATLYGIIRRMAAMRLARLEARIVRIM